MKQNSTRDQIMAAADQLIYERGFEHTSFADIAAVVGISRGNFYYHFKTKDEILNAVIQRRLSNTTDLLQQWELEGADPKDRIISFIQILLINQAKILRHGCPVGSLSLELAKLNHGSRREAQKLFTLFRSWLRQQFSLLGRKTDADALAMHLLARSQGVATLASAFNDRKFIEQEVHEMRAWLQTRVDTVSENDNNDEKEIM